MDPPVHRKPASPGLVLVVLALALPGLAGCEALGLGFKKTPVVPPPPERKTDVDISQADRAKAASQAASKPTTDAAPATSKVPVKLDGSAATGNSAAIPNSPTVSGNLPFAGAPAVPLSDEIDAGMPTGGSPDSGPPVVAISTAETDDAIGTDRVILVGAEGARWKSTSSPEVLTDLKWTTELEGGPAKLTKGQIAVVVNGVPIFAEDVIRQLPVELQLNILRAEKEWPPEKYQALRRAVIDKNLQPHIEQELLLQALKLKLKPEQLKEIQTKIDALFNAEGIASAMKQAKVETPIELEAKLREQGVSIDALRTNFRNRQLAQQYMGQKVKPREGFDRPDILEYYQAHREDYAIRAQARWEQIQLKFAKYDGKEGARKKAGEILKKLESGAEFASLAKEFSNGPTASKGGFWDWTKQGSLKASEIDQALFEQPIGKTGPPIETEDSVHIIRVIGRTEAGYEKFEAVQEDIKAQLRNAQFHKAAKKLMKELTDKAAIEKFTDRL